MGERVGDGFRRLAEESATDVAAGRKAAPADARRPLARAALTSRRIDGAAAASWLAYDPADEDRRLQTHDLLVCQAERSWRDYLALYQPAGAKDEVRGTSRRSRITARSAACTLRRLKIC